MISNFIVKFHKTFFLTKEEKNLYKKFYTSKSGDKDNKKILIQCTEDHFYVSLFGLIVKSLRKNSNNDVWVEQYVLRSLFLGASKSFFGLLKSIFFNNRFRDNKWIKLHSSYCNKVAFRNENSTSLYFNFKALVKAFKIFRNLKSKQDVLDLVIDDIVIGDLVYDSYLRYKPEPTVNVNDIYLCIIIWQSIRNIENSKKYFESNNVSMLLTSYSSYISHGIPVRVALEYNVIVYSFGNYGSFLELLTKDYWYHTKNCSFYKKDYKSLNSQIKNNNAKNLLLDRLNGKIDLSTSYMKTSAYKITNEVIPDVKNSVIIFLHDFFDSPHVYNGMVFPDFFEWITTTIKILNNNKINFFIKGHPNQTNDSKKVLDKLKLVNTNIKFISPKITNKQLVENGICAGITVHGTVAHELAYLNIPIILCGNNPHSSYDFCFEAKDLEEYKNLLKKIDTLTLPLDYKEQVESFYYMHNLNNSIEEDELLKYISNLRNSLNILSIEKLDYLYNINDKIYQNKAFKQNIKKLKELI